MYASPQWQPSCMRPTAMEPYPLQKTGAGCDGKTRRRSRECRRLRDPSPLQQINPAAPPGTTKSIRWSKPLVRSRLATPPPHPGGVAREAPGNALCSRLLGGTARGVGHTREGRIHMHAYTKNVAQRPAWSKSHLRNACSYLVGFKCVSVRHKQH